MLATVRLFWLCGCLLNLNQLIDYGLLMTKSQMSFTARDVQKLEPEDFTDRSAAMYAPGELESGGGDLVQLTPRCKVNAGFVETVDFQLQCLAPNLQTGYAYQPPELIGEALWTELSRRGKRYVILCLRYLATLPGSFLTEIDSTGSFIIAADVQALA